MAVEKGQKSVTLVKGPKATGKKVFGFRIAPKDKPNGGRVEIGDKPTRVALDTPEASKINLRNTIENYCAMGFLKVVSNEPA